MSSTIHVAGWMLLHFVWQGALIAIAAAVMLQALRSASAQVRYAAACAALAAMLAAPVITVLMLASAPLTVDAGSAAVSDITRLTPSAENESAMPGVAPTGASARVEAVLPLIVIVWIAGVALMACRLAGGWRRVRRLHRAALAAEPSGWSVVGDRVATRLALRRRVHIADSVLVDTPTLIGYLRPVILLPIAALANLTPQQVGAILAHELVHVRRHDYLVNMLQTVAETVLFFHPAVWWVSSRIRTEREHCCDDVVVATCGDAVGYASALAELETWRAARAPLTLAATGGSLVERVRRMLQSDMGRQRTANGTLTVALVALFVAVIGGTHLLPGWLALDAQSQRQTADWQVLDTAHFRVRYLPELAAHRDVVAREAERAYRQVSADFRHALAFVTPVTLFATRTEAEREGWSMPADPGSPSHILLAVDAPDRIYGDLVHELTHVFTFDILPASRIPSVPTWISEGLAEYQRNDWDAGDVAMLNGLVATNAVPGLTTLDNSGLPGVPRLHYNLGHAAFDFIEAQWGKDGMRRFLFELRRGAPGGIATAITATFGLVPDDFDRRFAEYLRARVQAARP